MAQAGIHGLVGMAVRRWAPARDGLMLGIVLGNLLPDVDNLAVAIATLAGSSTEGLHRTFTHSLFFVAAIVALFYGAGRLARRPIWGYLGLGLGTGVLMHILLDLLIWFDGVEILWPLPSWVNLWENVTPPDWWSKLMMPAEFLFLALFLWFLARKARAGGTDRGYLPKLRVWTIVQGGLFAAFTVLVYTLETGFRTPYGALYLLSLGLVFGVAIRMRKTVEAPA
jgi:membrane-bound metal-dependent hydrolase YbcI (DUF457 family)